MQVFFAILIAAPVAVGLTCFICAGMLKKSNDFGDSQGTVYDFSGGIDMYAEEKSRSPFNRM